MGNPDIGQVGKHFSSTYQPKYRGRRKSKIVAALKEMKLSAQDVRAAFSIILDMGEEELKATIADKKKPWMFRVLAKSYLQDWFNGNLGNTATMLERALGKPVQPIEHSGAVAALQYSPEERKAILDEYYKNNPNLLPGGSDGSTGPAEGITGAAEKTEQEEPGPPEDANP